MALILLMHKIYGKITMHLLSLPILLTMKYIELLALEDAEKMSKEIMKKITAEEFDTKFDNGEDIDEYLDFSTAIRLKDMKKIKTETKKVNVDFPEWVIESLDKEAKRIGVTRQSIIKVWIAERLKEEAEHLQVS